MSPRHDGDEFAELFPHLRGQLVAAFVAAYGPEAGRETAADVLTYARHHWVTVRHRHDLVLHLFRLGRRISSRYEPRFGTDEVSRALIPLSADERLAIVLHDGLKWAFDEIGEVTGLSVAAIHRHLDRARAKVDASLRGGFHAA